MSEQFGNPHAGGAGRLLQRPAPMQGALEEFAGRMVVILHGLWGAAAPITAFMPPSGGAGLVDRVVGVGAALVWVLSTAVVYVLRSRLPRWIAIVDCVLFGTLLVLAGRLLPPHQLGDGASWIFTGASISVFTAALLLRPVWTILLTGGLVGSYLTGLALAGQQSSALPYLQTAFLPIVQCGVGVGAVAMLRANAVTADHVLRRKLGAEHAFTVAQALDRDRKKQEDLLHDYVLTTLGMIAESRFAEDLGDLRRRCQEALGQLRELAGGRMVERHGDLAEQLEQIREEHSDHDFGVRLLVTHSHDSPGRRRRRPPVPETPVPIPPEVAAAIAAAVRECVVNARKYARVVTAEVELRTAPDEVRVFVADAGVGFDPSSVRPDARGVRDSVLGRMASVGGGAELESARGKGTEVTLRWPARGEGRLDEVSEPPTRAATEVYAGAFTRLLVLIAAVWHLQSLYYLIAFRRDYLSPTVVVCCWTLILFAGTALALGLRKRWMTTARARIAGLVVVGASITVVMQTTNAWARVGFTNWAIGDAGWILALMVAYCPLWEPLAGVVAVAAATAGGVYADAGPDAAIIAKLLGIVLSAGSFQVGVMMAYRVLRRTAAQTAQRVARTDELVARQEAAAEVATDRARRSARITAKVIPLLESMVDGTTDPRDAAVRRRCSTLEAALRRAAQLEQAGHRARDLAALTDSAARHGVDLTVGVTDGDGLAAVPQDRRERMVSLLDTATRWARPGSAHVTVVTGLDLTSISPPDDAAEKTVAEDPVTLTLSFVVSRSRVEALRARLLTEAGRHPPAPAVRTKLDYFEPERPLGNSGASDSDDIEAWFAVAYVP